VRNKTVSAEIKFSTRPAAPTALANQAVTLIDPMPSNTTACRGPLPTVRLSDYAPWWYSLKKPDCGFNGVSGLTLLAASDCGRRSGPLHTTR
jgi:hypothetical protein